jgi:hypothetical protein
MQKSFIETFCASDDVQWVEMIFEVRSCYKKVQWTWIGWEQFWLVDVETPTPPFVWTYILSTFTDPIEQLQSIKIW